MKYLLVAVNAKYIHSNPAVYSLRAYAGEKYGEHIELAEYTINQRTEDILADIYQRKPDAIGFSCYIWNIRMIRELLAELPKVLEHTELWLGGPEVSYDAPGMLIQFPHLKGIIVGEGEATFRELMAYYVEGDRSLSEIAGLYLPEGFTPMRPLLSMDELPFLYGDLEQFQNRIIYYESARGCPYSCSYCLSSIDKRVRLRSVELVQKELQFFLDKKVPQVKFVDRTFNCVHEHAMAIWKYISEHDNGVTNFHFEISADILRPEEIALLNQMRPGLVQLEIGVQSTNPDTISAIDRVMNVERLEQIVASIRRGKNIHQHLDLIAGLPGEDYNSFRNSFDRVYGMKPDQLQLGFLKVLKGSPMEERAGDYELIYTSQPPYEVLKTKWLSYEEVLRLKQVEEMVELYYNSNQFRYTLAVLEKDFPEPFAMFEQMAAYYREKGYFLNSPARAYRYQVLYDFALSVSPGRKELYRELLVFDLYLREKVKSRPEFAGETGEDEKEYQRAFYLREEREHRYLKGYEEYDHRQLAKMTHLEHFTYPVWDPEAAGKGVRTSGSVLFDYRNRDALTYDAAFWLLED
ncbi:MAG: B12-binding domain-containing radical SAM protein [Acetatifactor sp.]